MFHERFLHWMEKKRSKRSRRSKKQIAEAIFDRIEQGPTTPSKLRSELGLSQQTVDEQLNLITDIQNQPTVKVEKAGKFRSISLKKENGEEN